MKKHIALLLLVAIFACDKNPVSNEPEDHKIEYSGSGKPAIVMVLENKDSFSSSAIEAAYKFLHKPILELFSDFFKVPAESMDNLTLNEIIDIYCEPWQINILTKVAEQKYEKIIVLTDDDATSAQFFDTLQTLGKDGYDIDVILNLHGSQETILFSDGSQKIKTLVDDIRSHDIHIRALYQTCCYGSWSITSWQELGICAVNGAKATNGLAMFSPIYFLENWMAGQSFDEAVQHAYENEIKRIRSYDTNLPISSILLTKETLTDSEQMVGGLNSNLNWNQFPVKYFYPQITSEVLP